MKTIALSCALALFLLASQASALTLTLIDEDFSGGSGALQSSTNPVWSDDDASASFEVYNSGGAGPRGMQSTYDHDNNLGTPNINIPGGIEVNDDAGPITLTASLLLDEVGGMGDLSFFAGRRGSGGVAPTLSIFNVTTATDILLNEAILTNGNVWTFNEYSFDLLGAQAGDTLEVRFFGGGNNSASGLQLTDVLLTSDVPEPATAVLGLFGLAALARRRRQVA